MWLCRGAFVVKRGMNVLDKREKKDKQAADRVKEQPATYDMYAAMPDDGHRYEIIDGVMEMMSPGPSTSHQSICRDLMFILMQSCKTDYIIFTSPIDVILSQTNVVQPDVLMIHRSRSHIVSKRGIEGAPDLVVEILSPGSRRRDKRLKMRAYEAHGVPEYWIIDPDARTLEQYVLSIDDGYQLCDVFEGDDKVASDKLPCVSFSIDDIFHDMLH